MELENTAANTSATPAVESAAPEQNPASSAPDTKPTGTASSGAEGNVNVGPEGSAAPGQAAAAPDVTQTQAFSRRLNEERQKIRREVESEYAAKQSKSNLEATKSSLVQRYTAMGYAPEDAEDLANGILAGKEYFAEKERKQADAEQQEKIAKEAKRLVKMFPETYDGEKLTFPEEVKADIAEGSSPIEAMQAYKMRELSKELDRMKKKETAGQTNAANAASSTGSMAGAPAADKDFYTSAEWDKLPFDKKQQFIKNGKVFQWQRKW